MGSFNRETGEVFCAPRPIDPQTHSADMEWVELSGRGTLAASRRSIGKMTAMIDAGFDRKALRGRHRRTGRGAAHQRPTVSVDGKQPDIAWIGAGRCGLLYGARRRGQTTIPSGFLRWLPSFQRLRRGEGYRHSNFRTFC